MSAFDCVEKRHSWKISASRLMPSAKGIVAAHSTASIALKGAFSPLYLRFLRARSLAASQIAAASSGVPKRSVRSLTLGCGPPPAATPAANSTAPANSSS